MKNKLTMTVTVAVVLVGCALLFASRQLSAQTNSVSSAGSKILYYTCPMHPSVRSDKPGNCQVCGMKLQPVYEAAKDTNAPLAELDTNALPVTNCCGTDSPTNSEK